MGKKINYIVYRDHLGDSNTDEMNDAYIDAVQNALASEYPDAYVSVELVDGNGFQNGGAFGFDNDDAVIEECHTIANEIWNRADYA